MTDANKSIWAGYADSVILAILSKHGTLWDQEEKRKIALQFFEVRGFFKFAVGSFVKKGMNVEDAEVLAFKFFDAFVDKRCTFDPDRLKYDLTLIDKFEIFLARRIEYRWLDYLEKEAPPGFILSFETPIGENITLGDALAADTRDPANEMEYRARIARLEDIHEQMVEADERRLAEEKIQRQDVQKTNWELAKTLLERFPKKQRQAIELIDFEGIEYEGAVKLSGQTGGSLRTNLSRARQRMTDYLNEHGISYESLRKFDDA